MNTSNLEPRTKNLEPHSHISKGNLTTAMLHTIFSLHSLAIPCHFRAVYTGWKHGSRQLAKIGLASLAAMGVMAGAPERADADLVAFSADQVGNVTAPVYGLGANSTNYLLTGSGATATLPKDYTGNGEDSFAFGNPDTAKDAASFDETLMLQLGGDNNVYKVDLSNGSAVSINGNPSISAGNNSFGIGYDANANVLGIGRYDSSENEMTFLTYDFNLQSFTSTNTFVFNQSQYGTPTGLDFKVVNGQQRMIVGTRDGPAENIFSEPRNFVLDMSLNGSVGQHFVTSGDTYKLEDVLIDLSNDSISIGYSGDGGGRVEVGNFSAIPEVSTLVLGLLGAGALGAYARRKKEVPGSEFGVQG